MVSGRPMFPGSTAENELTLIFKMLGTPNDRSWPGVLQNQSFVEGIPKLIYLFAYAITMTFSWPVS